MAKRMMHGDQILLYLNRAWYRRMGRQTSLPSSGTPPTVAQPVVASVLLTELARQMLSRPAVCTLLRPSLKMLLKTQDTGFFVILVR